jgi:hypothetical protein
MKDRNLVPGQNVADTNPEEAGKNIREKGRGGRLGHVPRQYVADTTPEEAGKNITEKGRRGRIGAMFLGACCLYHSLGRQVKKYKRES